MGEESLKALLCGRRDSLVITMCCQPEAFSTGCWQVMVNRSESY